MTRDSDSPHLAAQNATGELYFGCAEKDPWTPISIVQELSLELSKASVNAEVEVYPGVDHAFAFQERPTCDKAAAERHWERMPALFRRRMD